jgi:hypothetical protein
METFLLIPLMLNRLEEIILENCLQMECELLEFNGEERYSEQKNSSKSCIYKTIGNNFTETRLTRP